MIHPTLPSKPSALLFYKSTCKSCRILSKLAVILSIGVIRRLPITGEQARQLYQQYPQHEGQLILLHGRHISFGPRVFAAVPHCILLTWWQGVQKASTFIYHSKQ